MSTTEFIYDQKQAVRLTRMQIKHHGRGKMDSIRRAVDQIAGQKPLNYRQDLFSVVRETWHMRTILE